MGSEIKFTSKINDDGLELRPFAKYGENFENIKIALPKNIIKEVEDAKKKFDEGIKKYGVAKSKEQVLRKAGKVNKKSREKANEILKARTDALKSAIKVPCEKIHVLAKEYVDYYDPNNVVHHATVEIKRSIDSLNKEDHMKAFVKNFNEEMNLNMASKNMAPKTDEIEKIKKILNLLLVKYNKHYNKFKKKKEALLTNNATNSENQLGHTIKLYNSNAKNMFADFKKAVRIFENISKGSSEIVSEIEKYSVELKKSKLVKLIKGQMNKQLNNNISRCKIELELLNKHTEDIVSNSNSSKYLLKYNVSTVAGQSNLLQNDSLSFKTVNKNFLTICENLSSVKSGTMERNRSLKDLKNLIDLLPDNDYTQIKNETLVNQDIKITEGNKSFNIKDDINNIIFLTKEAIENVKKNYGNVQNSLQELLEKNSEFNTIKSEFKKLSSKRGKTLEILKIAKKVTDEVLRYTKDMVSIAGGLSMIATGSSGLVLGAMKMAQGKV